MTKDKKQQKTSLLIIMQTTTKDMNPTTKTISCALEGYTDPVPHVAPIMGIIN